MALNRQMTMHATNLVDGANWSRFVQFLCVNGDTESSLDARAEGLCVT